ncbi:hypothetical protein HOK00_01420 [bacterium]|nr:hypothetical protein [bacterium]
MILKIIKIGGLVFTIALLIIGLYLWYNPGALEYVLGIIARITLLLKTKIFIPVVKAFQLFFFKKGIVSFANLAWKRVLVVSFFALIKRLAINKFTAFFTKRVVKPLLVPGKRWLNMKWGEFKDFPLWKKIASSMIGGIITSFFAYFAGISELIAFLLGKISLAKFLTAILTLLANLKIFFGGLWTRFIQPYLDIIIITIVIGLIEKIPYIGRKIKFSRIMFKWNARRYRRKKDVVMEKHVDKHVKKVVGKLHKHVNKKILKQKEKESSTD